MKVLIIRFSSIGDIVLTTPVIRCVKQQVKDAELHFITKPQFREVLSANPHIDKLHLLQEHLIDTVKSLRRENFDYVIDLHHNQRSFIIKQALFKSKSSSYYKQNVEKWLMVNLKINKLNNIHIVDRYMDAVSMLGVKNDGRGLDYFIPDNDHVDKNHLPPAHRNGYIGWVIGALHHTKKFPVRKIIEACKKVAKPVVLLGGKNEFNDGDQIAKHAGELIFNACGKFSLNQSASLVSQASVIVTNDTGLMHIAAAFKKPIISLWGNTIPEFGMKPYYGSADVRSEILEIKELSCRPCSKLGYRQCPKKHFKCMEMIAVPALVNLLNDFHR